ncbi:MAG: hypothetical protein R3Y24_13050 [Eubacteriales bacterium]
MEAYIKSFLKKFIASLYLSGVKTIPFSGDEFQCGIDYMQQDLKNDLEGPIYDMLSDIFVKSPVQETYNKIRDLLMSLNGDTISFVGVDNPYWTKASIKMNDYYARKLLDDKTECDIDSNIIYRATEKFCEAAGVTVWDQF